jgi:hypothetical protein
MYPQLTILPAAGHISAAFTETGAWRAISVTAILRSRPGSRPGRPWPRGTGPPLARAAHRAGAHSRPPRMPATWTGNSPRPAASSRSSAIAATYSAAASTCPLSRPCLVARGHSDLRKRSVLCRLELGLQILLQRGAIQGRMDVSRQPWGYQAGRLLESHLDVVGVAAGDVRVVRFTEGRVCRLVRVRLSRRVGRCARADAAEDRVAAAVPPPQPASPAMMAAAPAMSSAMRRTVVPRFIPFSDPRTDSPAGKAGRVRN